MKAYREETFELSYEFFNDIEETLFSAVKIQIAAENHVERKWRVRELIHHHTDFSKKLTLFSDFKIGNIRLKSSHSCIEIADPEVRVLCSWTQPKRLYTHFPPVSNIYSKRENWVLCLKKPWEGLPCE